MPIATLLILSSLTLAISQKYPWQIIPGGGGRIIWLGLTAAFVWLLLAQPPKAISALEKGFGKLFGNRMWLPALAAFNMFIAVCNYLKFGDLGYGSPIPHAVVFAAAFLFMRRDRFEISCLFNLGFLAAAILVFPVVDERSDMLPVIQEALNQWWRGKSPYGELDLPLQISHMPYLPGTFISHFPAWFFDMDLRWNQFIYRLLWMIPLIGYVRKMPGNSIWIDVCHFFVLCPYIIFRHELYFEVFLLLMMLYVVSPRWRWLTIPLLIATRQWAWVIAPFMIVSEFKQKRWLFVLHLFAGSAAVVGGVYLLLAWNTDINQFISTIFFFQRNLHSSTFGQNHGLTLVPIFYWAGFGPYLQIIQAVLCVILFFIALKRPLNRIYWYSSLTLILFLLFNCHFWLYLFISVAFWAICTNLIEPEKESIQVPRHVDIKTPLAIEPAPNSIV